jgi:hypothetical protein
MRLRALFFVLTLFVIFASDSAFLDKRAYADARLVIKQPQSIRQIELSIRGSANYGFGWYDGLHGDRGYWGPYAVGPGVQLLFPIVKNAIPSLNNPMYLGFFTDLLFVPSYADGFGAFAFSLAIGPVFQWRFVILDLFQGGSLSAFTNLGFGLWPWFTRGYYANNSVLFYGFPLFELGANLFFTRSVGITLSFGYPSVKFGLSLAF